MRLPESVSPHHPARAASTSVVDSNGLVRVSHSVDDCQALRGHLAAPLVRDQFEAELLSLAELADPSTLHRADMDEGILAAVIRRNKAKALLEIKPLHGSRRHEETLS